MGERKRSKGVFWTISQELLLYGREKKKSKVRGRSNCGDRSALRPLALTWQEAMRGPWGRETLTRVGGERGGCIVDAISKATKTCVKSKIMGETSTETGKEIQKDEGGQRGSKPYKNTLKNIVILYIGLTNQARIPLPERGNCYTENRGDSGCG